MVQTSFHKASAHVSWSLHRIAIWDRNRIAVGVAIGAWSASVAFQIHSKSTRRHTIVAKNLKSHSPGFFCIDITQVGIPIHPPNCFRGLLTDCLQLGSTWVPAQSVCMGLKTDSSKKNLIATLTSDVVLLLTMLVGLLRLRQLGTMFALGQFLWRQVGTTVSCLLLPLIRFP